MPTQSHADQGFFLCTSRAACALHQIVICTKTKETPRSRTGSKTLLFAKREVLFTLPPLAVHLLRCAGWPKIATDYPSLEGCSCCFLTSTDRGELHGGSDRHFGNVLWHSFPSPDIAISGSRPEIPHTRAVLYQSTCTHAQRVPRFTPHPSHKIQNST